MNRRLVLSLTLFATTLLRQPHAVAAADPVVRIGRIEVEGAGDETERLSDFLSHFAPTGTPIIEPGPLDLLGAPVGTTTRLRLALVRLGYEADIRTVPNGGTVDLKLALRPVSRVRQVFVVGNWPLRQEEILRRLTLRAGQPIPDAGPLRDSRLGDERQRVVDHLRAQGYLDADVNIAALDSGTTPNRVNISVRIARGPGYPIGAITVQGNRSIDSESIARELIHMNWLFLWTRPLPFRLALLQEDISALTERYRELGFPGPRITHDFDPKVSVDHTQRRVHLGLRIDERKRLTVAFEGHKHFDDDSLKEAVTFFTRGSYDNHEARTSAGAIAHLYRSSGYLFAAVTWRRDVLSPEQDRITFSIDEGPRIRVRAVDFTGNTVISTEELADVVNTRPFPLLGSLGLGEGGYASILQLEADVDRIALAYESRGYPKTTARCLVGFSSKGAEPAAILRSPSPAWRKAKDLFVRFEIQEAPRVTISTVRFETTEGVPLPHEPSFLAASLLDTRAGAPFRPAAVRADAERLKRLMGDEGYPHSLVEPVPTADARGTSIDLLWRVTLRTRVRVGPVFIRGNFLSSESSILEWVDLRPGAYLTTTDWERSQRNLALIQQFNNANPISFPAESTGGDSAPMLIEVEERHDHLGVIKVGGGGSTEQKDPASDFPVGVFAAAGYEHQNLFGQGWTLRTRGELGSSLTKVEGTFVDPRIAPTRLRLELGGNYFRQSTVRLGELESGGGSVGIGRELAPGVDGIARWSLRRTLRTESLLRGAGPDVARDTVHVATVVGALGFDVVWQRLDNPLVPTRGFRFEGGFDYAHPALSFQYGEDSFLRLRVRSLVVIPLRSRLAIRHSVRFDQGFPLGGASVLPKTERYFAGGDTTLRGFELDRARSEGIGGELAPGIIANAFRPVGGSLRLLHSVDLQYQVAGPLYFAVFADTGIVTDALGDVSPSGFRHAAGFSPLMLRLPIGDLTFAWAWPLDPRQGDSRGGRLVFNVGLMF